MMFNNRDKYHQNWNSYIGSVLVHSGNTHEVVRSHLEFLAYQSQGNLDEWKKICKYYLRKEEVESIEDQVRIY
jgi:hypothetical protein